MKGEYANGAMIGEWNFFDENGHLPDGKWEWRFAASKENIRMKGQLVDGRPNGVWNYWATANQGRSDHKQFQVLFD